MSASPTATATPAESHAALAATTPFTWSAGSVAVFALAVLGSGVGTFLWLSQRGSAGGDLPAPLDPIPTSAHPSQGDGAPPQRSTNRTGDQTGDQ